MLTSTEEKKQYFNRYWQTRELASADARSRQRAEMVCSLLNISPSKKILDIGCGRGLVMSYLAGHGFNIAGCDLATETMALLQSEGYEVFLFDIEKDELPQKYDVILCLEVLQQLFNPLSALKKFSQGLNDDGCLIISVPNEFHLWTRLKVFFGAGHLGHFDESHVRLFSPERARELFRRAGLIVEKMLPVSIIPPENKWLSRLGMFLARIVPSLFSLSLIYRLKAR